MTAMGRGQFILAANAVWLTVFAMDILVVLAPDYVAWWKPNIPLSCHEDTYRYDLGDRTFVFGFVWLLTTPLMNVAAWRLPARWPDTLSRPWWNAAAPGLSWATTIAALALVAWPLSGVFTAPVTSHLVLKALSAVLLAGVAWYYRAAMLSA